MRFTNKYVLKELVSLGILSTKPLTKTNATESDSIIEDASGSKRIVVTDKISDEEIKVSLELKKIELLKSIKDILKFFVVITIISALVVLFYMIFQVNISPSSDVMY